MIDPHPDFTGVRFCIDGGDGDQTLFGAYMLLERVTAPWFDSGEAKRPNSWLMRVIGGTHSGLVFALSPRTLGTIDDGIAIDRWKSVVLSGLPKQPRCDDRLYPEDAVGGMTFMERI